MLRFLRLLPSQYPPGAPTRKCAKVSDFFGVGKIGPQKCGSPNQICERFVFNSYFRVASLRGKCLRNVRSYPINKTGVFHQKQRFSPFWVVFWAIPGYVDWETRFWGVRTRPRPHRGPFVGKNNPKAMHCVVFCDHSGVLASLRGVTINFVPFRSFSLINDTSWQKVFGIRKTKFWPRYRRTVRYFFMRVANIQFEKKKDTWMDGFMRGSAKTHLNRAHAKG